MSLWLLATLDGIGSAREVERRCETDIPYLWLLGTVSVNHHTLGDFRVLHGERLERLLVDTVAALVDRDLVPLETVAQDGMRVRASAGSSSFRRRPTLEKLQQAAQEHVYRLKKETENETDRLAGDARRKAAAERAARERLERLDEALQQHDKLRQQREERKKGDGETTRTSTTDPDARKMKMANGGYDPAFNVQFATDGDSRVIVGVDVTNEARTAVVNRRRCLSKVLRRLRRRPPACRLSSIRPMRRRSPSPQPRSRGRKSSRSVPRGDQLVKRRWQRSPFATTKGYRQSTSRSVLEWPTPNIRSCISPGLR